MTVGEVRIRNALSKRSLIEGKLKRNHFLKVQFTDGGCEFHGLVSAVTVGFDGPVYTRSKNTIHYLHPVLIDVLLSSLPYPLAIVPITVFNYPYPITYRNPFSSQVEHCDLVSPGVARVRFSLNSEAERARGALAGTSVEGRPITVDFVM